MNMITVQVQLGNHFADLSIKAQDDASAIAAAKALVASDASLKTFRHRFTNYVV